VASRFVPIDGEKLDRFELLAELASGGMATVFLARLLGVAGFQRLVAIKRLHPHLAREQEFIEMFLDEARLAAKIHHPNVVPIQEVGESRGYYLVMDYVEGDTLARLLTKGTAEGKKLVGPDVVIRIVLDTLAGLQAAHDLPGDDGKPLDIVHRDVSPQNVLVGVDGIAKLTDFGVARASARLSTTRTGQLKGKLSYMAPEQARGELVDRRADVFAAGIVLWEGLSLRRLFRGDGEAEVLTKILNQPIPSLRSVAPTVPAALDAVCMRALARDRDERYGSAAEFAEALEKAARSLRILASPRDVAACLDTVMGDEIRERRELVRNWIMARPDSGITTMPASIPAALESVTRVEAPQRRGDTPASHPRATSSASLPDVSSQVSRQVLAAAHEPVQESAGSVTSAAMQVGILSAAPPPEPRPRRGALVAALVLLSVSILAAAIAFRSKSTPAPQQPQVAAVTAAPSGAPLPATPESIHPDPKPTSSTNATATGAASSAATVAGGRRWPVGPGPAVRPPPAGTSAQPAPVPTTPDDMRNPYR
jgi:eukaryotic-like serine/threonine-protein kinase